MLLLAEELEQQCLFPERMPNESEMSKLYLIY